ncbi:uncharacterized protein EDB93DRAFT_1248198 [Suillus bovinus]|uniref:uncharacterized protein n=1 Tax=Suillus bovinus TaxID=48563 RepID=UPI001B867F0E|nr:uncharacterized protein EDB93DRAFT_1248198 [Suillus bovinus]KAG2154393.1 hypothetical protein EDB93DRAFT_1248198 [Suillus bovinus]
MVTVVRSPTTRASNSHTHDDTVPTRRIRFAPLPEPTAQVDNANLVMDTNSSALSSNIVDVQHNAPSNLKPKSSLSRQFNLFKRSSPDPSDLGASLSRSASIPLPSNSNQPRYLSTSIGSDDDHHTMPQNSFLSPSRSTSPTTRPRIPANGVHMLNGRVYGSKRQPLTNLFANVRDEPEFVEWGYGGMGSISSSSDSKYSVLAKGSPALLSHNHAQEVGDGAARERKDSVGNSDFAGGDSDDGSGMEWVRKRRQKRERLARGNTC